MKYPRLIRGANTPIKGILMDGEIGIDGTAGKYDFSNVCVFQESDGKRVFAKDKGEIILNAEAYIDGDICEALKVITGGTAVVNDVEYEIVTCSRKRDPDGAVNFTRLGLI